MRDFRLPTWSHGNVVDVDTEDGMEYAVTVIGPSESGDIQEMRVRFADGVVRPRSCYSVYALYAPSKG